MYISVIYVRLLSFIKKTNRFYGLCKKENIYLVKTLFLALNFVFFTHVICQVDFS
jgi:hypothetical protein